MNERLKTARIAAGFSSAMSAAKKHDWKTSTYAAHENGQNEFDPVLASAYGRAFKVSAAWLMTGEGSGPQPEDRSGLRRAIVRSFDPDEPDRRVGDLDQPLDFDPEAQPDPSAFPADAIKELAPRAGMGAGQTLRSVYRRDGIEIVQQDALKDDYWRVPSSIVRGVFDATPASMLVVECAGDSMQPTLAPGERVWVNTSHRSPSPDGIYAIRDPLNEIVVKRLHVIPGSPPRISVISDNSLIPTETYAIDDLVIVGRVVAGLKLF